MGKAVAAICTALLVGVAGCAATATSRDAATVLVEPDDPRDARAVRFEVPTSMVMGLPGQYRLPVTGQARLATRAIAADALAARGLCLSGFDGPAGIHFSPDRTRAAFIVHCRR